MQKLDDQHLGVSLWLRPLIVFAIVAVVGVLIYLSSWQVWIGLAAVLAVMTFLWGRNDANKMRRRHIASAFSGLIPPSLRRRFASGETNLQMSPCGRTVTLLYCHLNGFSDAYERMEPEDAITRLRALMDQMTELIHERQGVIVERGGEGLVAMFGYHFDGGRTITDHADSAVSAAIAIQSLCLDDAAKGQTPKLGVFPPKVGIVTDYAYIGNVGDGMRVEFKVVGKLCELGETLARSADNFGVMLAASTFDFLTRPVPDGVKIAKRLTEDEEATELKEAYEMDPFVYRGEDRDAAILSFLRSIGVERREQRWPVAEDLEVGVMNSFCTGRMLNFSVGGCAVILPKYLGNGLRMNLFIGAEGTHLRGALKDSGLSPVSAEIRWGRPFQNEFLHGIQFKNLTDNQRSDLIKNLRQVIKDRSDGAMQTARAANE